MATVHAFTSSDGQQYYELKLTALPGYSLFGRNKSRYEFYMNGKLLAQGGDLHHRLEQESQELAAMTLYQFVTQTFQTGEPGMELADWQQRDIWEWIEELNKGA